MNPNNIREKLNNSGRLNFIDFTDSPFSKIIAYPDHINKVISVASEKFGTSFNTSLARGINVDLRTWNRFIKGKYIKSLTYERINRGCNFSPDKARKNIQFIDEIQSPKLPLDFDSKSGARIDVGIFNEGRMRNRSTEYHNMDNEIIEIMIKNSKKILGKDFTPKVGIDKRNNTYCIYFPPLFAKHYSKMNLTEKSKKLSPLCIPQYILANEDYHKIWWQGNLSEEASIYPFVNKYSQGNYLLPRIQLNRVISVNIPSKNLKKETTYYHKDISPETLNFLKANSMKLMQEESQLLETFDIHTKPYFSKIYVNKLNQITATYTILLYTLKDLERYSDNIGFELNRHKKQMNLLLGARGRHSKNKTRDIIVKFYKLVPKYLSGIKKVKSNKWLTKEDKHEILGD